MTTTDWKREYHALASLVGTVLDDIQYMIDDTEALMKLYAKEGIESARMRGSARVQALQDTLDLWEETDYV